MPSHSTASTPEKPSLPVRSGIFWFCLFLGALMGLNINLIPMTFKVFSEVFGAGYEMQGRTEMLYFLGSLVGALMGGYATSRLGTWRSARLGMIAGGFGCLLIGSAHSFLMVQWGSFTMGFGSMWLSVVSGTIIAQHFQAVRQRVFSAVLLSMAIAGTLAPRAMGSYLDYAWEKEGWPWWIPYAALTGVFLLSQIFVPSKVVHDPSQATEQSFQSASLLGLLRSPALWLIAFAKILHGLGQMGAVVWLGRLYQSRLDLGERHVGTMLSANLLGFICGRIFWTLFGERLPDRVLLGCSAAIGSIFYVLTISNSHYETGLFFMFVAGLGMSGDVISMGSYTAFRFRHAAPKAFALTDALGQLGGGMGPYFIGFMGEQTGTLEQSVWIIPLTVGTLSLLGFSWQLTDRVKS